VIKLPKKKYTLKQDVQLGTATWFQMALFWSTILRMAGSARSPLSEGWCPP
jgi:hypothetical protein